MSVTCQSNVPFVPGNAWSLYLWSSIFRLWTAGKGIWGAVFPISSELMVYVITLESSFSPLKLLKTSICLKNWRAVISTLHGFSHFLDWWKPFTLKLSMVPTNAMLKITHRKSVCIEQYFQLEFIIRSLHFLYCASSPQYIKIFKWIFLPTFVHVYNLVRILGLKDFGTGMEVALFYPKIAPRVFSALVCS